MLKVQGKLIVDEQGNKVVLKGYNIGNWMMMENFMLGYSGEEEEFRSAVLKYAGQEKYDYFFDRFLFYFLGEKDIAFMKEIGVNCIRIPFNYRHFESDNEPYRYNPKAMEHLDHLVELCRKYQMYIILDMHAVQGYQSTAWHCDNNGKPARLYTHAGERDRFYKLWAHIAAHYKDEEIIAGYDVINEPDALTDEAEMMLNQIYREVAEEIRSVDPNHIIFIAGNTYNKHFDKLEAPFAENLVYTCHYYLDACTSTPIRYPGEFGNITYDRNLIEHQMNSLDEFMRKYEVPCWVGEFGVRLNYQGFSEDRLRAFGDQLDCICKREHHYSIWSYKDIGFLSTVTVKKDSPWLVFVDDILRLKKKYFVDRNFHINEDWGITTLLDLKDPNGFDDTYGKVKEAVADAMKTALGTELAEMLGKKFAGLSEEELDRLASSFAFENCTIDEKRLEVIKKYGCLDA